MESVFLNLKSSQNLINNLVIVSRRPPDYISPCIESIDSDQIEMYTKMYAQMTRMNGKRNNGRYGYKGNSNHKQRRTNDEFHERFHKKSSIYEPHSKNQVQTDNSKSLLIQAQEEIVKESQYKPSENSNFSRSSLVDCLIKENIPPNKQPLHSQNQYIQKCFMQIRNQAIDTEPKYLRENRNSSVSDLSARKKRDLKERDKDCKMIDLDSSHSSSIQEVRIPKHKNVFDLIHLEEDDI